MKEHISDEVDIYVVLYTQLNVSFEQKREFIK